MWKWVLRKWSGQCELLRITYENQKGAKRTKYIGKFYLYISCNLYV